MPRGTATSVNPYRLSFVEDVASYQREWAQQYANAVDRAMLDDILEEQGYPWKVWMNKKQPTHTPKGNLICDSL